MSATDAQLRATKKYLKEKLDDVRFRVPKGQREIIQQHAAKQGESVNAFICRAVRETMERDNMKH